MSQPRALSLAVAVSAALLAAIAAAPAHAQDQPATADQGANQVQEVVVTGSRIAAPNATSTSPIQVVTSRDIELSGKTDVSELLYQLPQNFNNSLGQDFSNRTSGLTTAGGVETADLRGLGPQRTLVLVNGRRLGQGDANTAIASPAPDLDQIPLQLVERVDVLTGGASSVYGSDAIAGVVNFVMKKNFEGVQVDYQIGENWHDNHSTYAQALNQQFGSSYPTGSSHDGRTKNYSILAGTNFMDGKGNITGYLGYVEQNPVTSGERDFGACQLDGNQSLANGPVDQLVCAGSPNSNYFVPSSVTNAAGVNTPVTSGPLTVVGNQLLPWGTPGGFPPQYFNSQPYIYAERQDQRYTAGFLGHIDFQDWLQPYAEFGFMNDRTTQAIAPSGMFAGANPDDPLGTGNYQIPCSNAFLSAQEFAAIGCTAPTDVADVQIGRRNAEGAGRNSYFEHTNYRAVLGSKGAFADAWTYDAYAMYYYTTLFNSNNNYMNFQSIDQALLGPGPGCTAPCVPYNIFNQGGVTQDQLKPLYLSGTAYGTVTERTLHGDVTGDLGKYGVQSPLAKDGLAVNVGYEHRGDKVVFQPDSGEESGQLSGFGGASVPLNNSVSVDEEFIELRAPLIQDKPLAQELVFDTGFRHSDYTSIGTVNTHKFELQWAPIGDFRLRASFNRAIRAPLIIELYNPALLGQIQGNEDPCAPSLKSPGSATYGHATATLAQCLNTVSAAQAAAFTTAYGNGISPSLGGTDVIPQGAASQLSQLQGGNVNLKPEVGNTYTLGVNLTPGFLPTFNASFDYYHIKIADEIGTVSSTIILQNCLQTGNPALCSFLVRSPATFGLQGASAATGGYIVQTNVNVAEAITSGIDVQANYKQTLGALGSLDFTLAGTYMISNKTQPYAGAHTYDCAGLFGASCQTVNPRWRHNMRTTWVTPWFDTSFFLNWRYIGPVSLDNNSTDPTLHFAEFGVYDSVNARIMGYNYFDVGLTWQALKQIEIRAGVNNVLDKDPPLISSEIVAGGAANTYEQYDTLGRELFLAVTAKF